MLERWPTFGDDERSAVDAVLRSGCVNAWTSPETGLFEDAWCAHFKCKHALAFANGTLTLEAALLALQIPAGADVLVSPRTFVASASAIVRCGANPVFADVDTDSGAVTVDTLEAARTPGTRAAIVVHLGGWPADMPTIMAWGRSHDICIIEDAAQAHGAMVQMPEGNWQCAGTFGDAGSWSFCQDKIMSTGGEGGMLVFKDDDAADRAWSLRDHGKSRQRVRDHAHDGQFAWWVDAIGSNLRMTAMQAAIGRVQLTKLPDWLEARARNASILHAALDGIEWLHVPRPAAHVRPVWYRCYAHADPSRPGIRDRAIAALAAAALPAGIGSCPEVYNEDALAPWRPASPVPVAHTLGQSSLCFPCHPTIEAAQMQHYADAVVATLSQVATAPLHT